jgi:HAD superfamily hydrolase (TIGR01509 family)
MSTDSEQKAKSLLSKAKGIILDFDGLIADSEPFHYKAYNAVFEKYGHTLDPDEYWVEFTSKGKGIQGEIERHNLKLDADPDEMRKQKFEIYSQFCRSGEIKLFPEAKKFVELLRERYKIAIASGSFEHDIRAILKNAGTENLVSIILGKDPSRREKPYPDIFLKAAEQLGLAPSECLVVEDALKGLTAAKEAGIPCIIVRNHLNMNIDFSEADLALPGLSNFNSYLV